MKKQEKEDTSVWALIWEWLNNNRRKIVMEEKVIMFVQSGGGKSVKTIPLQLAKDMGYKVAVVEKNFENEYGLADYGISVDTDNMDLLITEVVNFSTKHNVASILTFTEFAVEQTSVLAKILGLPGLSVKAAKVARNKFLTRVLLEKAGIKQNKFMCISDLDNSRDAIETKIGYPVIVKPLKFAGSCAVTKIDSIEEFEKFVKKVKLDRKIAPMNVWSEDSLPELWLCEEYLDGYEISVECIVNKEQKEIIAIHDKMAPMNHPPFLEQYFVTPSPRISADMESQIVKMTRDILECIDYDFGLAHVEFRVTKDGPCLLEVNARLGGLLVGKSVENSTGVNMFESLIKLAMGQEISVSTSRRVPTAFGVVYASAGIVKRIEGIEKVEKMEEIKLLEQWIKPGDTVMATEVGYGTVVLAEAESSERAYEIVYNAVKCIKYSNE